MRVLVDECLPQFLKQVLPGHVVQTVQDCGWAGIKNGKLLRLAEEAKFDVFVTSDKNLRYQQNLSLRKIAIIELSANRRVVVKLLVSKILDRLGNITPGDYTQINHEC